MNKIQKLKTAALMGASALVTASQADALTLTLNGITGADALVVPFPASTTPRLVTAGTAFSYNFNFDLVADSNAALNIGTYNDTKASAVGYATFGTGANAFSLNVGGPVAVEVSNNVQIGGQTRDMIRIGDLTGMSDYATFTTTSNWLSNTDEMPALSALASANLGSFSTHSFNLAEWRGNVGGTINEVVIPEPATYAGILGLMTAGLVGYRRWNRKNVSGM